MHHLFLKHKLDAGKQEDHREEEQRLHASSFETTVDDGILVDEVDQGLGSVCGTAAGQQLDLREALEGAGDIQEQNEEHLGRCNGQDDVPDTAQGTGTVQISTFQQIFRHVTETDQQEDEADTDMHPDRHNNHGPGSVRHGGRPADLTKVQELVEQTVLLAVDEQEDRCQEQEPSRTFHILSLELVLPSIFVLRKSNLSF